MSEAAEHGGHGVMSSVGAARHLIDVLTGRTRENPLALDRTFVPSRGKTR